MSSIAYSTPKSFAFLKSSFAFVNNEELYFYSTPSSLAFLKSSLAFCSSFFMEPKPWA